MTNVSINIILHKFFFKNVSVKDLIEKGITGVIKGFKGKREDFETKLKMKNDFKLEFYFEK